MDNTLDNQIKSIMNFIILENYEHDGSNIIEKELEIDKIDDKKNDGQTDKSNDWVIV
jgi:hypothetical protein